MIRFLALSFLLGTAALVPAAPAVPKVLNHQGRMVVNGINFDGTGLFKFALVNAAGSVTLWSNDGTSTAGGPPAAAVSLPVARGLYSVLLGDTQIPNMTAVPAAALEAPDVRLRIWFNDGTNGFELITPDQRLASVPYALVASTVEQVLLSSVVAPPVRPVVAWGRNNKLQTAVPPLSGVVAIAAGTSQSLALLQSGGVVAWGDGPAVPAAAVSVTNIAAGAQHFLARRSDGSVVAWGDNSYGQAPASPSVSSALSVAAGERHSLALLAGGTIAAWGDNSYGQTTVPPAATGVTAIASGYDHCLALTSSGTVIAWGRNESGESTVPAGLVNVVAIGAGAHHSLAVKSDGTVVCWGWNAGGQTSVPLTLTNVVQAVGGYACSAALRSDGSVVVWGDNTYTQTIVPEEAASVQSIAAGADHLLALRSALIPAAVARVDQANTFKAPVGIKRAPAANTLEVEGSASKSTAGAWLANSDARIKTEIQPVTGALEKLSRVRLVDFRYTDAYRATHPGIEDKRYLNVIAQEFARVFPGDVKNSGETLPDGSPILQVDTYPLTIYSAAAVQELHRANEDMRRENQSLKQQLASQEERLRKLEAAISGK